MTNERAKVSIIILSYNSVEETTKPCIASLYKCKTNIDFEAVIVDNGSKDGTPEYLESIKNKYKNLRIILNEKNVGFASASNIGLKSSKADYYVLLNSDTIVTDYWLDKIIAFFETHADVGMVGPVTNKAGNNQCIFTTSTSVEEIIKEGLKWTRLCNGDFYYTSMLSFFCVAIRQDLINDIGFLEEDYGIGYFEDDDYCLRAIQKGYKLVCMEDIFIFHKGGISFRSIEGYYDIFLRNLKKFENKFKIRWERANNDFVDVLNYYSDSVNSTNISKMKEKIKNRTQMLKIANYGGLFREYLNKLEQISENEKISKNEGLVEVCKSADNLTSRKAGGIINYFSKFKKLKNVVRKIPSIKQIFLEKDALYIARAQLQTEVNQLRVERKQLQVEKEQILIDNRKYKSWVHFLLRPKTAIQHNIATIINFSTTDFKFLKPCINEVAKFSKQIIIPISDYLFDGTPENRELLENGYKNYANSVNFVKFNFDPNKPVENSQYWVTFSRWIGVQNIKEDIEYILFLDVDEIIEGDRFLEWLNHFNYKDYEAIFFGSYWYFRETKFRALTYEMQGLFVKKDILREDLVINKLDRHGIFNNVSGNKLSHVFGLDDNPMVHHYSWVRTKEEMLKKVKTWGHSKDRNWISLVESEFQREFTEDSTDFVHGYKYKIVKPYVEI